MTALQTVILVLVAAGATGVVLMREERDTDAMDEAADRDVPPTSDAVRLVTLGMTGPTMVLGWYIVSHGQVSPGGGFQGGIILATAVILVYLAGQLIALRRISPIDLADAVEAVGAGSFVAIGVSALALGAAYLTDVLPLGTMPGSVDSSGTIALISFFVGVEVTAAFILIVAELLEQTLIVRSS